MTSGMILILFSFILLIFGLYSLLSAVYMKRTGVPPAILVSKEELPMLKDAQEFCKKLFRPTLLFGFMACLYGGIELVNEYRLHSNGISLVGVLCFAMVCLWFTGLVRDAKKEHLSLHS